MWSTALASEMVVVSGGGASSVISYCGVASQEVSEEESSVPGEAEYASSVYSSEVVSAMIRLCFNSLCLFSCARVEHPSGFLVDTPFLFFHCTSGLGISRLLDKGVRLMLLGLSHWRHAMQTYHQMTSTHECNNQQITVSSSTRDGQIPDT